MYPYQNLSLENIEGEEWRPVVGYEGYYEISSFGRVKSLSRTRGGGIYSSEKILKQSLTRKGYCSVGFSKHSNGKTCSVHSLVALMFIGERPPNLVIDHIDNNPLNNQATNLRYLSNRENISKGHLINSSKLTGAIYDKKNKMWVARIGYNRVYYFLGCFKSEIDAHEAYNKALLNLDNLKISNNQHNHKWFLATSPTGEEYTEYNASVFCKTHSLQRGHVSSILNNKGNRKHHKGWTFKLLDKKYVDNKTIIDKEVV